jgi:hypothetical protein
MKLIQQQLLIVLVCLAAVLFGTLGGPLGLRIPEWFRAACVVFALATVAWTLRRHT